MRRDATAMLAQQQCAGRAQQCTMTYQLNMTNYETASAITSNQQKIHASFNV